MAHASLAASQVSVWLLKTRIHASQALNKYLLLIHIINSECTLILAYQSLNSRAKVNWPFNHWADHSSCVESTSEMENEMHASDPMNLKNYAIFRHFFGFWLCSSITPHETCLCCSISALFILKPESPVAKDASLFCCSAQAQAALFQGYPLFLFYNHTVFKP